MQHLSLGSRRHQGISTKFRGCQGQVEVNGELPDEIDAGRTFKRVLDLLDADVPTPVVNVISVENTSAGGPVPASELTRSLGISPSKRAALPYGAYVDGYAVFIWFDDAAESHAVERVLAHEFVHFVQQRTDSFSAVADGNAAETTDEHITKRSVEEGVAMYAEAVYADRYLDGQEDEHRPRFAEIDTALRFSRAPYHYGEQYVETQIDDPADHELLYENPPENSGAILHGELTDGPSIELSIDLPSSWHSVVEDRTGEVYLRTALSDGFPYEDAAELATGLVDDQAVAFVDGDETVSAWAFRWETEGDAEAVAEGFDRFLDDRNVVCGSDEYECGFIVERPSDRSVSVAIGPEKVVDGLSVTERDGIVYVE